ncbi:MAG TPA: C25 family cysteine peptidase, partial [Phycisphaerae bacterium]|nr:C25 family cysteine peptidase [Phycisphaerae bacterium]
VQFAGEFLCGYSLGVLEVFPVCYEAASRTLTYYSDIGVTVTTGPSEDPKAVGLRDAAADAARVLDLVDNDSAIHGYDVQLFAPEAGGGPLSLPAAGPYEYVVITSQALEGAFQPLVDHKIARGLSATIVTTEYIYDHYASSFAGEDDAAGRIREFITDAYANWNTRWVLLGGDTDQVAHRMVQVSANGYTATFASDMYFACLDGPYNGDGDSHWADTNDGTGGGDVDRAPEVFVGRAAVSTFAEAGNFVAKTILQETSPPPNPTTGVWIGEKLSSDPLTWGATSLDAIIAAKIPDGFNNITLYERDGTVSKSAVISALNDSPNIVNHLGHSSYTGSATLSRSDVDGLTNAFPYFL